MNITRASTLLKPQCKVSKILKPHKIPQLVPQLFAWQTVNDGEKAISSCESDNELIII